jgi:hypothetical protein
MTTTAATRPFALATGADASWCGATAGFGADNTALSVAAHRIRLANVAPSPQMGSGSFAGRKQGRPPRGEPR